MSDKTVLVIGRSPEMLTSVLKMIEDEGYKAVGSTSDAQAKILFDQNEVDAVIIGGGVDSQSRSELHKYFSSLKSNLEIIDAHPQTVLEQLGRALN